MSFEEETFACIRQYDPGAEFVNRQSFPNLACKAVRTSGNIVFHLVSVPFDGLHDISSLYFQKQSIECASHGIQLIHLWQDQWIAKQEIIRSRIAALLGSGNRIHARQTTVKRITKDDMRSFFDANHLQGSVNARYNYGLYACEQLVAAASFSAGRTMTRNGVAGRSFELLRYASLLHHRVVGGMGKLIARFTEELAPDDIMTYADLDWASGKGYEALHFTRITVTPPQMFWIHPAGMTRYYPHRLPAELTNAFGQQNYRTDMDDFMKDKGYIKIYNAGNLKYLLIRNN